MQKQYVNDTCLCRGQKWKMSNWQHWIQKRWPKYTQMSEAKLRALVHTEVWSYLWGIQWRQWGQHFFIILPVWWSTLLHYWIKTTMLSTSNQKWVPRLNSKQEPNTKRTRQQHFWRNQSSAFSLVEIPCFGTGQQLQQCFGWYVTTVLWVWRNALLRWSTVENVSSAFIWSFI